MRRASTECVPALRLLPRGRRAGRAQRLRGAPSGPRPFVSAAGRSLAGDPQAGPPWWPERDVFSREYFGSLNSLSQSLVCVCACCGHKCTAVRCTVRTGEGAHLVPKALWTRSCDDPHRYAHPKGGLASSGRSQPQIQRITANARNGWQVEGSCSGRYGFIITVTEVLEVGKGKIREGAPRSQT